MDGKGQRRTIPQTMKGKMKFLAGALVSLSLVTATSAQGQQPKSNPGARQMIKLDDIRAVAPALEKYTQDNLLGDVWKRPGLAPRERSIITVAALIARNQTAEMPRYFNTARPQVTKMAI